MSNLLYGFAKIVKWIGQTCYMFLSPFAEQNQVEILSFEAHWLGILILEGNGPLGPLCLWQSFLYRFITQEGVEDRAIGADLQGW